MTRSFFSVIGLGFVGLALAPALLEGCKQTGVGDPCTPEQEYDTTFNGFAPDEVDVESKSFQCQTRLCLVNHFRGRVSCPYGQDKSGAPSKDGSGNLYKDTKGNIIAACGIPGSKPNADGTQTDANKITGVLSTTPGVASDATVEAQCQSRTADKTVYCSCRCANADGRTDDGANYCKCPDGFSCEQLVTSIGPNDSGLTGAYCIRAGTIYKGSADTCKTKATGTDDCAPNGPKGATCG